MIKLGERDGLTRWFNDLILSIVFHRVSAAEIFVRESGAERMTLRDLRCSAWCVISRMWYPCRIKAVSRTQPSASHTFQPSTQAINLSHRIPPQNHNSRWTNNNLPHLINLINSLYSIDPFTISNPSIEIQYYWLMISTVDYISLNPFVFIKSLIKSFFGWFIDRLIV